MVALMAGSACTVEPVQKIDDRTWQLTWSDEFDDPAGTAPQAVSPCLKR